MVGILKSIWKRILENRRKGSDEYLEEEEHDEFIEKIEKRIDRIPSAQKAETHESRAQVALMFEQAYTQKKLTEVNNSLRTATWILAITTFILAYTTLIDSVNKSLVVTGLKNMFILLILVILLLAFFDLLKSLIKFIIKILERK